MATHRTKADLLQELESIKGLLLENEDIPILQELLPSHEAPEALATPSTYRQTPAAAVPEIAIREDIVQEGIIREDIAEEQILHYKEMLSNETLNKETLNKEALNKEALNKGAQNKEALAEEAPRPSPSALAGQHSLFDEGAHQSQSTHTNPPLNSSAFLNSASPLSQHNSSARPAIKASGENPFLPQHIRARLHGNNPPPLFDEPHKSFQGDHSAPHAGTSLGKTRLQLVNEVLAQLQPQIERELRQRLFALNVDDLERLLNEDDD